MSLIENLIADFIARWPTIWAFDTGRYLIAATLMVLILAVARRAGLLLRRIQDREVTAADRRREILASLRSATVFSLMGFGVHQAAIAGWFTIYTDFRIAGPGYALAMLAVVILAQDAYFYWTHRLMHHRLLFKRFHLLHHRSVAPTPWAAYAFAVPEAVVQGAFLPLMLCFVPLHAVTIFAWMAVQIARNVMGHAGVEVHPRGMARSRWLGWNNTTTHHDMHHQTGRHNFGFYFTWWDRLMGTEDPRYAALAGRPKAQRPAGGQAHAAER
jgi:Delta7-sterol 5-desaturase